jgi:hypothetical protein
MNMPRNRNKCFISIPIDRVHDGEAKNSYLHSTI